jgi:dipeptidyl aminopeptidase/acylaminoacyl peptidase
MARQFNQALVKRSFIRGVAAILIGSPALISAQAQPPHFTVEDSIGMQRFTSPDPDLSERVTSFSPDGRFFAVVTTRGLLKENLIESTIWLFDEHMVKAFAHDPTVARLAKPKMLAHFKGVNDTEPGDSPASVRSLRWSNDGRSLFFLARANSAKWHLYRAVVAQKKISRLTPATQDVAGFDFMGERIAYAVALPCALYPRSRVEVGTGLPIEALRNTKRRISCPNRNQLWTVKRGHVRAVIDPTRKKVERSNTYYGDTMLAMSPNGRYAIVARAVEEIRRKWERYAPGFVGTNGIIAASPERIKLAYDVEVPEELILVDLVTGANSVVVNAPLGRDLFYLGPTEVSWSPDGRSVILTNLMLPLDAGTEAEKSERLAAAYVVQLDLQTHSLKFVTRLKHNGPNDLHSWSPKQFQIDWLHGKLTVEYSAFGPNPETYRLDKGHWVLTDTSSEISSASATAPINVMVRQDLNTPPALFVGLGRSAGYAQIWDPNPQFKNLVFGHSEAFSWKDEDGEEVRGVLIRPPDYQPNRQYPLVIEARSYRQDRFVVDGTYATAVAAQAMAADGLMVLQAGEPAVPKGESFRKGTAAALDGYKAAVAKLAAEGLVDPRRVGIIGFSRTCDNVMYAVTRAPGLFAAATIANGFTYGVMGYLEIVDGTINNGAMKQWWLHYGGNPLGDALETFEQESLPFNLYRVMTPVRVETRDPDGMLTDWETYAGLRSLDKPVDLILLPYATHVVSMPADVYASQQGDVDWFRFWLQGYEDPAPAKATQYRRWENLCDLQRAENPTQPSFCVPSRTH